MDEFAKCFQDADNVIITPIYSAGEQEISGINTSTIAHQIKLNSFNNASNSTHISENLNDAVIKAHNITILMKSLMRAIPIKIMFSI